MRGLVALLLAATCLSACAGQDAETAQESDVAAIGALRGVVVDATITPIAGATIQVQPGGLEARSDANGSFIIRDLEPGAYTLVATAAGYLETRGVAHVLADRESPIAKLVLDVDVEQIAFATPYHFQGYFECGVWPTNGCANINIITWLVLCSYGVCLGNVTGDRSVFLQWLERPPTFIQTEMAWESTQALGDALSFGIGGANEEELRAGLAPGYNGTQGTSPLMLTVSGQTLEESGIGAQRALLVQVSSSPAVPIPGGCVEVDPCGPGVQLLQTYEVFTHAFYGYEPPPGWRFTEAGEPPGP